MASVLRWIGKKVSNVSNSAAESILGSILVRFLEEPIQENTFSLELFQDWTLQLTLRKTFLCASLVNKYTPFLHFRSIYFSLLKLDVKYNLSKFKLEIDKIVLDIDAKMPDKIELPDEDIEASLTNLKATLPPEAKKSNSLTDFFLNQVHEMQLSISHFTTIIRVRSDLKPIYILFNDFNVSLREPMNIEGHASLKNFSFIVGEKRDQKKVVFIHNIDVTASKDFIFDISLDLVDIFIDKETCDIVSVFLSYIPQRVEAAQQAKQAAQGENKFLDEIMSKLTANFTIKTLKINCNGITLELHDFAASYKDGILASFSALTATFNGKQVLDFGTSKIGYKFMENEKKPASFSDFPRIFLDVFSYNLSKKKGRSNEVDIGLGSFVVNLSKDLIKSVSEVIKWFDSFAALNKPKQRPITENKNPPFSYLMRLRSPLIRVSIEDFVLSIRDINTVFMISGAQLWTAIRSFGDIKDVLLATPISPNYNILQCTKEESVFQYSLEYKTVLGKVPTLSGNAFICGLLSRIPTDLSFIDTIVAVFEPLSLLSRPENEAQNPEEEEEKEKSPMEIDFDFNVSSLFADYMTINMPSRLFLTLETLKGVVKGNTSEKLNIGIETNPSIYLTNTRRDIPLDGIRIPFQYSRYGFAEIAKTNIHADIEANTATKKTKIVLSELDVDGGVCADSMKLIFSIINHVQYGLDLPEERRTKTRKFDAPQQLLEIENTIKESLLRSLNTDKPIRRRPVTMEQMMSKSVTFESVDDMIKSVPTMEEERNLFDDLPDAVFSAPAADGEPKSSNVSVEISCQKAKINFKIFGGKDLDSLFDLSTMKQYPRILEPQSQSLTDLHSLSGPSSTLSPKMDTKRFSSFDEDEFEVLCLRDEGKFLELCADINNLVVSVYENDPSPVGTRVQVSINNLQLKDCIPNSAASLLFGIDFVSEETKNVPVTLCLDILNTTKERMELSLRCTLPDLVVFITQEQVNFLLDFISVSMPAFPGDSIIDEPLAFQYFELVPSSVKIFAHFRLWLDVHIDDVVIKVPSCHLVACKGGDGLAGELAEFYVGELTRPGVSAVIGGLPVIKNLRRIGDAVRNMFTFDARKYGFGAGTVKSISALLQVIAMETLNAGANAATIGERFLSVAMDTFSGKEMSRASMEGGLATMIISGSGSSVKTAVKAIPTLILAPGILSLQKLKELFKNMRDRINPEYKKKNVYLKK